MEAARKRNEAKKAAEKAAEQAAAASMETVRALGLAQSSLYSWSLLLLTPAERMLSERSTRA